MSNFPHKVDFKAKQAEFSAYIRNPTTNPRPTDVDPKRMQMYRELFFNNVEGFLSSNFPVLKQILSDSQWQQLAQDFFANHHSSTPYFSEIPEEFILYLQNERAEISGDYPFMLELAHYEWVEMALSISQDNLPKMPVEQNIQLTQHISLSPLCWLLAYQYPVHKISPDYLPTKPPTDASYLVVYRNAEDLVKFVELSPMSFYLLQTLQDKEPSSVNDFLAIALSGQLNESHQDAALEALQQFMDKQIILAMS
jgi:hypothetical protein